MRSHSQPKIESREVHHELKKGTKTFIKITSDITRACRAKWKIYSRFCDIDLFTIYTQPTTFNDALLILITVVLCLKTIFTLKM